MLLKNRIARVIEIVNSQHSRVAVLGAFGCGVFGNNPTKIAELFKKEIKNYDWNNTEIYFSIYERPGQSYRWDAFHQVFDNAST